MLESRRSPSEREAKYHSVPSMATAVRNIAAGHFDRFHKASGASNSLPSKSFSSSAVSSYNASLSGSSTPTRKVARRSRGGSSEPASSSFGAWDDRSSDWPSISRSGSAARL